MSMSTEDGRSMCVILVYWQLSQMANFPAFIASKSFDISHCKIYYYSIEIKVFQVDNNIIALKQQLLGIILCFFMYLKWPWLLHFFAKML